MTTNDVPSRCPEPEILAGYVDGRLSPEDLKALSDHLVDCERCYETVASYVRAFTLAERTEDVAPPWALAPAMVTAVVMAIALTLSLVLLGHAP